MYRFCQAERALMPSVFRDDSTRKQTQNRKPSAMRPTPKGCGFYGLFDNANQELKAPPPSWTPA